MILRDSHTEYTKRMHRVVEYIDQHLDEPLELSMLAKVAHFSAFHFHRLFSAWMGETLGDYLRRRRLEVAALRLVAQPAVPVLNIAFSVGFSSAEAFARAFKARFGCTATSWRQGEADRWTARLEGSNTATSKLKRNLGQVVSNLNQEKQCESDQHETSRKNILEVPMKVKIVERKPTQVACLRHVGPYGPALSEFWRETVYPWLETNDLLDKPRYGISHDDPGITAPEKLRYDACVEAPADFTPTDHAQSTTIPGGKYAVTRFRGTVAEIGEVWASLLRVWLPASGMQLDARPFFEYYPKDVTYDAKAGVFECDLCIPVVAL